MGKKPILKGVVASLILLGLYFGIVSLASAFEHAVEQFIQLWYWIGPLVIGFGIQVGLYSHLRAEFRARRISHASASVAATGGVSTTSMIACCAHHLADVLPIIGLSAAALFVTRYQLVFMIIGVLSNLIGITIMLNIIQRHKLFDFEKGLLRKVVIYDMRAIRNAIVAVSIVIVVLVVLTL